MRRISAHRDEAEAPIVDALRRLGASVFLVNTRGKPDLVIGKYGRTALGEVKTGKPVKHRKPNRKVRPTEARQQTFAETWKGDIVVELRTIDDALRLLKAMANHA